MRLAASRNFPGNIVTAALLLLLLLLWQVSSNGVVRGGDDDGSGIGGTGRMGSSGGESGFGGTGLKPYLGSNSEQEVQILHEPALRDTALTETRQPDQQIAILVPASPQPGIVQAPLIAPPTPGPSAIDIAESTQVMLDSSALYYEQLNDLLRSSAWKQSAVADSPSATADTEATTTWNAVAEFLSRNVAPKADPNTDTSSTQLAKAGIAEEEIQLTRPEPLQRPQLPPVQRVSPLQRAAILPPRVQPMRL